MYMILFQLYWLIYAAECDFNVWRLIFHTRFLEMRSTIDLRVFCSGTKFRNKTEPYLVIEAYSFRNGYKA